MVSDSRTRLQFMAEGQALAGPLINGRVMRVFLHSLQQIAGREFEPLLLAAGLARYVWVLPPDDLTPAATGDELAHLYEAIYQILGEHLTRLFHRTSGEAYLNDVLHTPWARATGAYCATLAPAERLPWFVQEWAGMAMRCWAPHRVSEDDSAWYLTAEYCPVCLGARGASAPLCTQSPALFSGLVKEILGSRVRIVEVECAAMGAPHCKYAVYKPLA